MAGKLTARGAATTKAGQYSDGGGLYLIVGPTGGRKWVYRFTIAGKVKMMGLGSAEVVTLAEARAYRDAARKKVAAGENPIEARKVERQRGVNFGHFAEIVIAKKQAEAKNEKHQNQWESTLKTYAKKLWDVPVDEINTERVLQVLKPIWSRIPETASRVRGRIENVIDAARAKGAIPQDQANPARWKGHLELLLTKRDPLSRIPRPALPYIEIAEFLTALRQHEGVGALALELLIMTAVRPGEVAGAKWSEMNIDEAVWTIPAARHKTGKKSGLPHIVPLNNRALEIVKQMNEGRVNDFVFPGNVKGQPITLAGIEAVIDRMNESERQWRDPVLDKLIVPHGFRSTFRDWGGDETSYPREVLEQALAHVTKGVEGRYRRKTAFEKRRSLMQDWQNYCYPEARISNVVSIKKSEAM